MFKLGLIINPFAGVGGRVGFKGSDGKEIREQALSMGAEKLAMLKTENCFKQFIELKDQFEVYTVASEMGEDLCQSMELSYQIIDHAEQPSTEADTKRAFAKLQQIGVDLVLFAGGDGTARDLFESCEDESLVLGIPAGVKIHSGVYAVSPEAAGLLVKDLITGKTLSLLSADVMDIDENAFREGIVKAKKYGYLNVPGALQYVQAVKSGGKEVEALVLDDIAAEVIESMEDDTYYVIGSGSTCAVIMEQLGLPNTLLGSDVIYQEELHQADAVETDLIALLEAGLKVKFIITVIGGQGHILGRGNHQLSPQVIRLAGWNNFEVVATKSKLQSLDGRPLLTDSGDLELDRLLRGSKKVITGYRDYVIYPVGFSTDLE